MPLRFPIEDRPLLVKFFSLSKTSVRSLVKFLQREPPALMLKTLAARVSQKIKVSPRDASQLLGVVTNFFSAFKNSGLGIEDFLVEFRKALEETGEAELHFEDRRWNEHKTHLVQILKCEKSIGVTSKALSVMTDHARVFRDARILTDLRPVFGPNPNEPPDAAVIVHTLKIEHMADHEHKEFFVALDSLDLDRLEKLVRRAKLKERGLKRSFKHNKTSILEPC
jgi:hypothetical protein